VAEPAGVATVRELGSALASQRGALESGQLHDLDRIIAEVSAAMDRVQAFPGGVAGLREAIEALPEPVRADTRRALKQAETDHRVAGELIRLAMQRVSMLRAAQAGRDAGAVYTPSRTLDFSSEATQVSRRA